MTPHRMEPTDLAAVDNALTTTRAIRRRLDLDRAVDPALIGEALEVAGQAPSAGAEQPVRWIVVTDEHVRERVGDAYRDAYRAYDDTRAEPHDDDTRRVRSSSAYLADVIGRAPILVAVCSGAARPEQPTGSTAAKFYASVYPAVWSFQIALRARGLGSCLTTIGLRNDDAIANEIDTPADWTQCALLPVAHITGTTLRPAKRRPTEEVVRWI